MSQDSQKQPEEKDDTGVQVVELKIDGRRYFFEFKELEGEIKVSKNKACVEFHGTLIKEARITFRESILFKENV